MVNMYDDLVTNPVDYIKSSFISRTSEHRLLTDNEKHFRVCKRDSDQPHGSILTNYITVFL